MKTRFFFLLLTAMLLSVGAFAQSNEPLREEAKYYWYVGTTKPTSLSEATVVDEYESPYTFTNPSTTEKCYVYVLTNADKEVLFCDPAFVYFPNTGSVDTESIPGYKISNCGRIAKGWSVIINVLDDGWKHFYVGTTQPTAENYETLTPQYNSLPNMNDAIVNVPSSGKIYAMFPYPYSPNQSQIKRAFTDNEGNIVTCIERLGDYQTIPFHQIWELTFEPGTTLTFKFAGDVNGDGDIDIADAVCVVNYIVGNPTPTFVELAADANGDGDIDIADAVTIVNYIVGNPSSLSPETTYYWYAGTNDGNEVNEDNYTSIADIVTNITNIPTTGTITANRQYIYFVMPVDKTLVSVMMGGFGANMGTPTIINNHKIYKSVSTIKGTVTYTIE